MNDDIAGAGSSRHGRHGGEGAVAIQAEDGDQALAADVDELATGIHGSGPGAGVRRIGGHLGGVAISSDGVDRQGVREVRQAVAVDHEEVLSGGVGGDMEGVHGTVKGRVGQLGEGPGGVIESKARDAAAGVGHVGELAGEGLDGHRGGGRGGGPGRSGGRQGVGRVGRRGDGELGAGGDRDVAGGDHAGAREGEGQQGTLPQGDRVAGGLEQGDGRRGTHGDGDGVRGGVPGGVGDREGVGVTGEGVDHGAATTGDRAQAVAEGAGAAREGVVQG